MKTQYKILLVLITMVTARGFADSAIEKQATQIDFNGMIRSNNNVKDQLQESIVDNSDIDTDKQANADKRKVMDFIDVEVSVGQKAKVVDRRFNSVGVPRIEKQFGTVQLVDDSKQSINGGI